MPSSLSLPRSTPEAQGIRSEAVGRFIDAIESKGLELHSFMLLRHGRVVAEGWWNPYAPNRPHMLFSLSKSFTSTAIGLAASEGLLSLGDAVVSYFPDDVPENVSPNLAAMTIRDLLVMGTGHAKDVTDTMTKTENWVRAFLEQPVEHEPGTHFVYNSGATYMLSAILNKVTGGETLLGFLQPRLLAPLGITGATWGACPRGIQAGGWGLSVTTEDIAKFGELYLRDGIWEDRRLLPEGWVREAGSKQISNEGDGPIDWTQGYGYQFWMCRHGSYRGDGAFGQFCIVIPEREAVVAITSGVGDMQAVLDTIWEHLLPAMEAQALAEDDQAAERLGSKMKTLSIQPPQNEERSGRETAIHGANYELEPNREGWKRLAFRFENDHAVVTVTNESGEHPIVFGRNRWEEGETTLNPGNPDRAAASMTWSAPDTLVLSVQYTETPFRFTATCVFGEESAVFTQKPNVSFGAGEPVPIKGVLI